MARQSFDTPSEVTADRGEVLVDGPGKVEIAFTPAAAAETSQRLLDGAMTAQGQQVEKGWEAERQIRLRRDPKEADADDRPATADG
ncbi:MAG TPA: hypothetical protein VIT45_12465 [Allosphingosinicella sp.]